MAATNIIDINGLIEKMSKAMYGVESTSWSDINKNPQKGGTIAPTYAFGNYQFVPHVHLDAIKKWIKDNWSDIPEQLRKELKTNPLPTLKQWENMRKKFDPQNPEKLNAEVEKALKPLLSEDNFIQKGFYSNWMRKDILPGAIKLYNKYGDATGFSLEAFVGLSHNRGAAGAAKLMKDFEENGYTVFEQPMDDANPISAEEYMRKFETMVVANGYDLTSGIKAVWADVQEIDAKKIQEQAKEAVGEINYGKFNNDIKKYDELKAEFSEVSKKLQKNIDSQMSKDSSLSSYDAFKNAGDLANDYLNLGRELEMATLEIGSKMLQSEIEEYEQIMKDSDIDSAEYKKAKTDLTQLLNDNPDIRKLKPGERDWKNIAEAQKPSAWQDFKDGVKSITSEGFAAVANAWNYMSGRPASNLDAEKYKQIVGEKIGELPQNVYSLTDKINETKKQVENEHAKKVDEWTAEEIAKKQAENKAIYGKALQEAGSNDVYTSPVVKKEETGDYSNLMKDAFGDIIAPEEMIVPDTFDYDPKRYKKQMPWEALAQGALALMGEADAKTPLPKLDLEVSDAVKGLAGEYKRIADMGLSPEEEAKMKDNISTVYDMGLRQLTRASGGNRNLVLGNIDSLNTNAQRGLTEMARLDTVQKMQALDKYAQAVQYIDQVNRQKKAVNHSIDLQEAQQKRQAGAQLAGAAWQNMMEEFEYRKKHGPGSANHRFNETMMFKLTGIDPTIEDDKSGNIKNTASYIEKRNQELIKKNQDQLDRYQRVQDLNRSWGAMTPEQQADEVKKYGTKEAAIQAWGERAGILSKPMAPPTIQETPTSNYQYDAEWYKDATNFNYTR
jgi:CRISPR/Cas system CMR-associated protein Cmr5 small subunit